MSATMDRETLLERLCGIEWDDFEVKAAAGGVPRTAYTTVSAFANTSGGWIVFGVEEVSGGIFDIIGVNDPDSMQNDFLGACRSTQKFSRPVDVRPRHFVIDDRDLLAFYIAPARRFDKPVKVRVKKAWFAYIRVGARDEKCTPEQEGRFLRDASADTFDTLLMSDAAIDALDDDSLRWLRGIYAQRHPTRPFSELSDLDFMDELGLVRDGQLTHAAALLLGRDKLITQLKPGGIVDFRLIQRPWSAEVPAHRFDDRFLSEHNIVQTLRVLIERFMRLVPNPFRLDSETLQHEAHPPEYPAIREALVNLLVHQDYSDKHRTARVLWYADRTLFENPGDSFVTLSEMLDGGASDLRNPLLARMMRQIGFAEQAGTGIPTIVRTWREVDRTPPHVTNDPGQKLYQLSLNWGRVPVREDSFWKESIGATVSPEEARILKWLHEVGTGNRHSARLATGSTSRQTRQMLDHLVVNGLIETVDEEDERYRLADHVREIMETTPEVAPEATPEATPEAIPEATPEATPEARLVRALTGEMSRRGLQRELHLKDDEHFRKAYLLPALDAGLIEMTLPDKPRSPRQKYRLTPAGERLRETIAGDET